MKKLWFGLAALMVGMFSACAEVATPAGFTDDYDAALKRAAERGSLIYIVFSGSDWCGGCMALERQLLSKSEFVEGVKDHWELVFIDSPKDPSRLSELGKRQNGQIRRKYGVSGFPSVFILDEQGNKLCNGDTGLGSAPAQVAERMNKFKIRHFRRKKLDEKIGKAKPGTKTRVLTIHKYLQTLERDELLKEKELLKEVIDTDKKMRLGLRDSYFYITDIEPLFRRLQSVVSQYMFINDRDKYRAPVRKELDNLEAKAKALKAPKNAEAEKRELVEAIREARRLIR